MFLKGSMSSKKISYIEVHIAVFLFGMTGLFGKLLTVSPLIIVLGRVFFSSVMLTLWLKIKGEKTRIDSKKDRKALSYLGILLACHWTTFFASVQLSNVAIGLLTFSTFPVFVSLFTPIIHKTKIKRQEIVFGLLTLVGIGFVIPPFYVEQQLVIGGLVGIVSGALYAAFTMYNTGLVQHYSGKLVALYEHRVATIVLLPSVFIAWTSLSGMDWFLLVLLGTVFTGIGHSLFINGLKNVTAYMASIITMLEPLYAIILAYLVLDEVVTINTGIGGAIILFCVVYLSRSDRKKV